MDPAGPRAVRLGGLLQDLLDARGRLRTSELLNVSERTLQRAEAEGRLTEQLCRALERYEAELPESLESPAPGAQPVATVHNRRALARLTRRVDQQDEQLQALPEDRRDDLHHLPHVLERLARLEASVRAGLPGGRLRLWALRVRPGR